MTAYVSPFAPVVFPALPSVAGVRFAAGRSGVRYQGRDDLLLAVFAPGTQAAGVFTKSFTASPCVYACRDALAKPEARALAVCAGIANAATGERGRQAADAVAVTVAEAFGISPEDGVFFCATGVIGDQLPVPKLTQAVRDLAPQAREDASWEKAARAIMTTDTYPKAVTVKAEIGGKTVTFCGLAKGSGMIAPNMATMLAFVFTDLATNRATLQALFSEAAALSYNAITVDGDTSTNDSVLVFATRKAGNPEVTGPDSPGYAEVRAALLDVNRKLALAVVEDGEGITRRVDITVEGAEDAESARTLAMAVANSPLVKTAIFGGDPNWGRVLAALGKAGVPFDQSRVSMRMGGFAMIESGQGAPVQDLEGLAAFLKRERVIPVHARVGDGPGVFTAYTTDLTYEYIKINADYRS